MLSGIMEDIKNTHIKFLEMKNILDGINSRVDLIEEKLVNRKHSNRNHPKGNVGRKKLERKKRENRVSVNCE